MKGFQLKPIESLIKEEISMGDCLSPISPESLIFFHYCSRPHLRVKRTVNVAVTSFQGMRTIQTL